MRDLFDRVAGRYDMANKVLSVGSDTRWRRVVAQEVLRGNPRTVLDMCSGTADQVLAIRASKDFNGRVLGADISREMLLLGIEKLQRHGYAAPMVLSDAHDLGMRSGVFDCVTLCFGVRNFDRIVEGLKEMRRVLRPQGKIVILEFTRPANRFLWALYRQYLTRVLPWVGGVVTGQRAAYRYLASSIDSFLTPAQLAARVEEAGFTQVRHTFLSAGIVAITTAIKKEI